MIFSKQGLYGSDIENFYMLRDELKDISGQVAIFASQEIYETYNDLRDILVSFWVSMVYRIHSLLTESSNKTNSTAECSAGEWLSRIVSLHQVEYASDKIEADIKRIERDFSSKLSQMHEQAKEELAVDKLN